jgi:hypothetical protein
MGGYLTPRYPVLHQIHPDPARSSFGASDSSRSRSTARDSALLGDCFFLPRSPRSFSAADLARPSESPCGSRAATGLARCLSPPTCSSDWATRERISRFVQPRLCQHALKLPHAVRTLALHDLILWSPEESLRLRWDRFPRDDDVRGLYKSAGGMSL